ncbi:MAG: hypothetical protein HQL80_07190 [Magnetococcales bacterium]|nr:hypothetical protein [Magnetococcales bacterium]
MPPLVGSKGEAIGRDIFLAVKSMNVPVLTLKFSSLTGGFNDTEARTSIADKEVQEIRDHAFTHHDMSRPSAWHSLCGLQYKTFIIIFDGNL